MVPLHLIIISCNTCLFCTLQVTVCTKLSAGSAPSQTPTKHHHCDRHEKVRQQQAESSSPAWRCAALHNEASAIGLLTVLLYPMVEIVAAHRGGNSPACMRKGAALSPPTDQSTDGAAVEW